MDESASEKAMSDLEKVKTKLFLSSFAMCREQINLSGQKSLNVAIQSEWKPLNISAMGKETIEMQRKNEEYYKVQVDSAFESLKLLLRQLASLDVEAAAFENTRAKLDRARERLHQLQTINAVVTNDLMVAEVLWLLMHFDMDKLRQHSQWNLLDQYQTENRSALRRIEIMRHAQRTESEPFAEMYMAPLNLRSQLNETGVASAYGLYDRLLQSVRDNLSCLGNKKSERFLQKCIESL